MPPTSPRRPDWDALLELLTETPRENGTAALHQTASQLYELLGGLGLDVELVAYTAQPYRLRLAGVLILTTGLLYLRWMRERRHGRLLLLSLLAPALLLAELDFYVPVWGWIGAQTQHHVVARLPVEHPTQRLLLTAHYDTKTDLLDHVERAPIDFLALPVVPLLVIGALAARRAARGGSRARLLRGVGWTAAVAGTVYGLGAFASLSAGAFVPKRSPGAIDDGASCALLVRLAEALAAEPLGRTEVEIAWLSAEEVGVQGSWRYAAERFAKPPALRTWVINLEGLGASARHQVIRSERFTVRGGFDPAPELLALLDAAQRESQGEPLELTPYPGGTDARSFLAHGVPALTLTARDPQSFAPRGLHSARDDRSRVDAAGLDASLELLLGALRAADARIL